MVHVQVVVMATLVLGVVHVPVAVATLLLGGHVALVATGKLVELVWGRV